MPVRSCLDDPTSLVVADASVAINLSATGVSKQILEALPNRLGVVQEVALELQEGCRNGRAEASTFDALVSAGHVELLHLGQDGVKHFTRLVSGEAAETLDDGEAATIAYAVEHGATALIDERKANRICADQFSELRTACTIDLLMQDDVQDALGSTGLTDAVFNALYHGRMRVLTHHAEWVVNLIGHERAAQCHSLRKSVRSGRV